MMSMTFYVSSTVKLLFDFWDVRDPLGMVLSVFVVTLLTVFYELLKVWRVRLETKSLQVRRCQKYGPPPPVSSDGSSVLESSQSELSLTPVEPQLPAVNVRNSWTPHVIQTLLHLLQVTLGYMLMLCVMSFNAWIFIGVIAGSALGYFISFPLLNRF